MRRCRPTRHVQKKPFLPNFLAAFGEAPDGREYLLFVGVRILITGFPQFVSRETNRTQLRAVHTSHFTRKMARNGCANFSRKSNGRNVRSLAMRNDGLIDSTCCNVPEDVRN